MAVIFDEAAVDKVLSTPKLRPLWRIAEEIRQKWGPPSRIYFGAAPYLEAMETLDSIHDDYGADDGRTIVLYFLANAAGFKGPDARRIKAELRSMVGCLK